jgi:uncharacterized protein (TIGR02453 family)
MAAHFSPALFAFLRDLKTHNNREWFADQRPRYIADVETPVLQFIRDFGPRLKAISRAYVADPRRVGGSMFRIHRDTRFSPDKSPFKTWVATRFAHQARKKVDGVPAFYLRLSPGESFGGGGVYHLDTPALTKIRQRIERRAVDEDQAVLGLLRIVGAVDGEVDDVGDRTALQEVEDAADRRVHGRGLVDPHDVRRLGLGIGEALPAG